MIRASEPPTNECRLSYGFLHAGNFMTYSHSGPSGSLVPIWDQKYHMGVVLVKKIGEKRMVKPLAGSQIRAARALLRWTADDLAREAALGRNTILRAEVADDQTSLTAANDLALRRALEAAGVEFIDEDGGGPGVRLRKRQAKKA
jgi:DNA-binding XRE family transcriptional regulator